MANKPKIATEEQWQDLANKVKSKATFTITDTDPGEGAPLAAGNFIAVYGQPALFPIEPSSVNWPSFRPVNYANQITLTNCVFNGNSQQVLLYQDGTVVVNLALKVSSALSAGTTYTIGTFPTELVMKSAKNVIFHANGMTVQAARAYVVGADRTLKFMPGANVTNGSEINISGVYNIYA